MDKEYIVLISYKMITKNSEDWIDRVEVVKTDRKRLLIVEKEILALNLPNKNGDMDRGIRFSDRDPDIVKPESDMIIYLPLPEDAYNVNKWRTGN